MKKIVEKAFVITLSFIFAAQSLAAQEKVDNDLEIESELEAGIPDEMDDLDDIFSTPEDTTPIITEPEPQKDEIPQSRRGIVFSGNLNARLGGEIYYPIEESQPGAVFESKLGFSARPTDYFSIKGTILVKFPEMELGLYELYMNYNFWNFAYVMAGKKELTWGNSKIFDTNILDDESNYEYNPEDLLLNKTTKMKNSKFAIQVDVPVWKFNLEGLVYYEQFEKSTELDPQASIGNLCYAAKLDANLRNCAFDVFWKTWADKDPNRYPQAIGCDLNFQLGELHIYGQYFTHLQELNGKIQNPRSKGTASLWWATRDKANLGFVLEYQIVYDWYGLDNPNPEAEDWDSSKYIKQYLAFQGVWARIGGSRFTAAVKYFHDFYEQYGTVIPGIKIHDIVPSADLDIGIPVYYGSKQKVGIAVQVTLNLDY